MPGEALPKFNTVPLIGLSNEKLLSKQFEWVSAMSALFRQAKTEGVSSVFKTAIREEKQTRRSCFRLGVAIEGQKQLMGHTLGERLPPERHPHPLNSTEVRYKVPHASGTADDVPLAIAADAFSCAVKDKVTGEKWYELPSYSNPDEPPIWSVCADSCVQNIPFFFFIFSYR